MTRLSPLRIAFLYFFLLEAGLGLLRLNGIVLWPWWVLLLPWAAVFAVVLGSLLFVLTGAFLVEWRSARARHRNRKRKSYQFHP